MGLEALAEDAALSMRDLAEQAAREAALCGDRRLLQWSGAECLTCRWGVVPAFWFNSRRSWVCQACGSDVPGAAPTAEQRGAGQPDRKLQARFVAELTRPLV